MPFVRPWLRRVSAVAVTALAATAFVAPAADAHSRPKVHGSVPLRIISMNDFHGNLQPPSGSSARVYLSDGTTVENTGGAAYLATHVKQLKKGHKNSIVVSAGDNIGASPLASSLFHDEPTIDFLNAIGLKASAVGNHEFDEGYTELLRIQNGGCNPTDKCQFDPTYSGAKFPYLGANVSFTGGQPALLPFTVRFVQGIPVGIIGITLQDLPSVVTPQAIEGLKFGDEVKAINRTAKLLDRFGVKAQIVLMHQGDEAPVGGPDDCKLEAGGLAQTIARKATPKVDAIFTGHSHQQYNCSVKDPAGHPRPLIQGLSFGRLLSVVDFRISKRTRDVIRSRTKADNVIVTRDVKPDRKVQAIVDRAVGKSAPLANRVVGSITADLLGRGSTAAEKPLGDVIADAQLAATLDNGAQVAITNPGGIRGDLTYDPSGAEAPGVVTYGEAFTVQPFANIMQTITMTGAQLKAVLEQQSQDGETTFLQVSSTLHYTWTAAAAQGSKVTELTVAGDPVEPTKSYRVSVNNFLAAGGDGFTVFAEGTDLTGGPIDLDAFVDYLKANPKLSPPPADRITIS